MAKTVKKTRESQYAEILEYRGIKLAQCSVLGFRFPDWPMACGFHFDLMNNGVDYLLFDSTPDGNTLITILKKSEQADQIRAIAQQAGDYYRHKYIEELKKAGTL